MYLNLHKFAADTYGHCEPETVTSDYSLEIGTG
jgi:hypothetical protein